MFLKFSLKNTISFLVSKIPQISQVFLVGPFLIKTDWVYKSFLKNLFVYKPYCVYPSPDLEAGKSEDFFEEIKLLELAEVITKNLSLENNPGFFKTCKKMASQIFSFFHFLEIFHTKILFWLDKMFFFWPLETNYMVVCCLFGLF